MELGRMPGQAREAIGIMKLSIDWEKFESLQNDLLHEIISSTCQSLIGAGISREKIPDLVTEIAFDVCCAIDGSTVIRRADGRVLPILTFAKDASREELISSGSGSWMHELVHDAVKKYLELK